MSGPSIEALLRAAEPASPRPLADLVARLAPTGRPEDEPAAASLRISGVTADSRAVAPGMVFVAIPGAHADGHAFAASAVSRGAVAVIGERFLAEVPCPQIVVPSARRALADAAAWWYGDPSRDLGVIGITGTDGKTTTSLLAAAALGSAGIRTGLIGTVATQIGGIREPNPHHSTTPEAPALQRALAAMVRAGDRAAIIETTSHGLALDRVAAIDYDVAILTNLTHEHLELHGTFQAYAAAKRSLFERLAIRGNPRKAGVPWPRTGIVNADDAAAGSFSAATLEAGARLITYGRSSGADVRLLDVSDDGRGVRMTWASSRGTASLRLHLGGQFNAWNALAALALGEALELDGPAVAAGLESVDTVPGRMEWLERGQPFGVVIDYAHSPASLAAVLGELAPTAVAAGGGLIAVFGSAGERDRAKRPLMGRAAAERCRVLVLTDEDPRGEDREAILREIEAGATTAPVRPEAILRVPDRRTAIREAMSQARPGDVVLLAGKGHESSIIDASGEKPWNEHAEAEAALAELGWST